MALRGKRLPIREASCSWLPPASRPRAPSPEPPSLSPAQACSVVAGFRRCRAKRGRQAGGERHAVSASGATTYVIGSGRDAEQQLLHETREGCCTGEPENDAWQGDEQPFPHHQADDIGTPAPRAARIASSRRRCAKLYDSAPNSPTAASPIAMAAKPAITCAARRRTPTDAATLALSGSMGQSPPRDRSHARSRARPRQTRRASRPSGSPGARARRCARRANRGRSRAQAAAAGRGRPSARLRPRRSPPPSASLPPARGRAA